MGKFQRFENALSNPRGGMAHGTEEARTKGGSLTAKKRRRISEPPTPKQTQTDCLGKYYSCWYMRARALYTQSRQAASKKAN